MRPGIVYVPGEDQEGTTNFATFLKNLQETCCLCFHWWRCHKSKI